MPENDKAENENTLSMAYCCLIKMRGNHGNRDESEFTVCWFDSYFTITYFVNKVFIII